MRRHTEGEELTRILKKLSSPAPEKQPEMAGTSNWRRQMMLKKGGDNLTPLPTVLTPGHQSESDGTFRPGPLTRMGETLDPSREMKREDPDLTLELRWILDLHHRAQILLHHLTLALMMRTGTMGTIYMMNFTERCQRQLLKICFPRFDIIRSQRWRPYSTGGSLWTNEMRTATVH